MLPDIDVIGFSFGIQYGDMFGHRGLTHSLCFALLAGGLAAWKIPSPKSQAPNPNARAAIGIRDLGFGVWDFRAALAWAAVGVPIAWGVWVTLAQALVLFSGGS